MNFSPYFLIFKIMGKSICVGAVVFIFIEETIHLICHIVLIRCLDFLYTVMEIQRNICMEHSHSFPVGNSTFHQASFFYKDLSVCCCQVFFYIQAKRRTFQGNIIMFRFFHYIYGNLRSCIGKNGFPLG